MVVFIRTEYSLYATIRKTVTLDAALLEKTIADLGLKVRLDSSCQFSSGTYAYFPTLIEFDGSTIRTGFHLSIPSVDAECMSIDEELGDDENTGDVDDCHAFSNLD